MQHTRRLTRVQHTKYYSCASYNCAAHKNGSCAAHKIELACSTRKITLVSHASLVRVTRQKCKTTRMLPHGSVNLEMSGTVHIYVHCMQSIPMCLPYPTVQCRIRWAILWTLNLIPCLQPSYRIRGTILWTPIYIHSL